MQFLLLSPKLKWTAWKYSNVYSKHQISDVDSGGFGGEYRKPSDCQNKDCYSQQTDKNINS